VICAGCLVGLWPVVAAAAGPVNLIANGGFEEGTAGWTLAAGHELVSDPDQAHGGSRCLVGEVTGPKRSLTLRRDVPVRAGNRYEFEIWARATNQTKLVLWAVLPGARTRQMIAAFERVPRRWRRYSVPISIARDGTLQLQIVAPSSHAAPAGRMWIDEVALYETPMPRLTAVSRGKGFNDEPALALAADGSVYVAWNSFRDGADSIQLARFLRQDEGYRRVGQWQALGGRGTYVLGLRLLSAGAGVCLLYAAEVDGNWDVYAVGCSAEGPASPIRVTSDPAVDVKPAGAWYDGTLWVAWESNRGDGRRVFVAPISRGRAGEPVALSAPGFSSYDPSLAVLQSGRVCVAWHSFREHNYDIYLRRTDGPSAWAPEERLTRAPTIDRHPVLVAREDELWLIYENALVDLYHVGRTNRRRVIVTRVEPTGLTTPMAKPSPFGPRSEGASATFDPQGRLWLSFLRPRPPRAGWDAFVTCLAGDRWTEAEPVSARKGMDRPVPIAFDGARLVMAVQNDDIPRSWSDVDRTLEAASDVFLTSIDGQTAPPARRPVPMEPLTEPEEPFEAAELRVARGEDLPTPTITYKGQTLKLFFGNLHEHTEISVCNRLGDQSVDESYQHMRDLTRYDFACATDHGYNINPYFWSYLGKLARANHDPGRFLTFLAEEWTSSFEEYSTEHPYGFYGHRNLIFADPYFPRWWNARNRQTPAEVWEELRQMNADFIHIPHQLADTGNVPTDWNFTDEVAQPVAEIFQTRGSYEYKGTLREARRSTPGPGYFLQDAWARGIVIGVIAAPDHGGGYGKACVYATELTREAILDAIRARHCYGTTAAKIVLDVRVDGHLMGETIRRPAGRTVEVQVRVRAPVTIDRVEICRNNQFIYTTSPEGTSAEFTFVDRQPLSGRSYYYVRVVQEDEEIAWSSPVWFGAK